MTMKVIEKMTKIENNGSRLKFDQMCRIYTRILKLIAVLPLDGRNLSFVGTRLLCFYFVFFSLIHWSMFVVYCFLSNSLEIEDICITILVIGVDSRYYMMLYKRRTLAPLINECRELWDFCTEDGQRVVKSYERKLRVIYLIFCVSAAFINITYAADALLIRLPPLEPNGTERRVTPYNWYADNTEEKWPGYWVIFFVQLLVVQNTVTFGVICDSIMPLLAMISAGYFKHLQDRMTASHENPTLREHELMQCIYYHQRLLEFGNKLSEFSKMVLFNQVFTTGYNISLVLIKIVSSGISGYKYVTLLCSFICQLHMVQWTPDHLHDESENVAFAAYSAYGESMDNTDLGKLLLAVITRAQQPVQLLAGGVFPLSLESFGNMMKSAFTFFTILRNLDV